MSLIKKRTPDCAMRIVVQLAGPPRGKAVKRRAPNHRGVYTDPKSVNREAALTLAAEAAMRGQPPTWLPVKVAIEQRFPLLKSFTKRERADAISGVLRPAKKPDWDNIAKLCDCLTKVVFYDDAQVVDGEVHKIYSEFPGLTIIVETIDPPDISVASDYRADERRRSSRQRASAPAHRVPEDVERRLVLPKLGGGGSTAAVLLGRAP